MFAKPTYDASASANINFGPGQRISPVCVVLCVPECLPLFVFAALCCAANANYFIRQPRKLLKRL